MKKISFQNILEEVNQGHEIRKKIYSVLETEFKKPIISFFTSFVHPVAIANKDVDMIECILQGTDISKGFVLVINSPGGSGLAAERIIQVCRSYSNNMFEVVVPKMAKSAATMICLGANKIYMSETAELGPIDPQVIISEGGVEKLYPVHLLIESYDELFEQAIKIKQPIEIFLQQLSKYDARDIALYKKEMGLAKDIAERALKTGILKDNNSKIDDILKIFTEPSKTKTHGRAIYLQDIPIELGVEKIDINTKKWKTLWELYVRLDYILTRGETGKIVESKDHSYVVGMARSRK